MIEVTGAAAQMLKAYMESNHINISSPLRVFKQQGCGGVGLNLELDQGNVSDRSFYVDGLTFLVAPSLMNECGRITVDFVKPEASGCGCGGGGGLSITSENTLAGSRTGCGCGPDSCGTGRCG